MAVPFCAANPPISPCLNDIANDERPFNDCPPAFFYIVYPQDTALLPEQDAEVCTTSNHTVSDDASSFNDSGVGQLEEDLSTATTSTDNDSERNTSLSETPEPDEGCPDKGANESTNQEQRPCTQKQGEVDDQEEQATSNEHVDDSSLTSEGRGSSTRGDISYSYLENSGYFHNVSLWVHWPGEEALWCLLVTISEANNSEKRRKLLREKRNTNKRK